MPDAEKSSRRTRTRTRHNLEPRDRRIDRNLKTWSICCVPGCDEFTKTVAAIFRDPGYGLPLCDRHLTIVARQVANDPRRDELTVGFEKLFNDRVAWREACAQVDVANFGERTGGDIYFVKIGELVKVGWTRDLYQRIKSYGASAVLLVNYPATRDDELALHRNLTPARAKGREWYFDNGVIAMYVSEALAKYGPPADMSTLWTRPPEIIKRRRRA